MLRTILHAPSVKGSLILNEDACRLGVEAHALARTSATEEHRKRLEQIERTHLQKAQQAEAERQQEHERLRTLARNLTAAATELKRCREQVEAESVRLALAVTARLIVRESADSEAFARAAVREIMQNVTSSDLIRIRVNPDDRAIMGQALGGELADQGIEIASDPSLERGGCLADTKLGTIDASVETRWARMVLALTKVSDDGPESVATSPARDSGGMVAGAEHLAEDIETAEPDSVTVAGQAQ